MPSASLARTLDALASHRNVAPFISRQLIQRFVTSNPSNAYVGRVAATWTATNGNLGQVLRTLLLDDEARIRPQGDGFGKAREPLVRLAALWRAFDARYVPPATGEIRLSEAQIRAEAEISFRFANAGDLTESVAQDSLRAPSVFNFFDPDNRLPTGDGSQGLYAPEFQILTEATYVGMLNQHDAMVWNYTGAPPTANTAAPVLDLSALVALAEAGNHAGMVDQVDTLLFDGRLGQPAEQAMVRMLDRLAAINETASNRAKSLVLLALASPEFAIQR